MRCEFRLHKFATTIWKSSAVVNSSEIIVKLWRQLCFTRSILRKYDLGFMYWALSVLWAFWVLWTEATLLLLFDVMPLLPVTILEWVHRVDRPQVQSGTFYWHWNLFLFFALLENNQGGIFLLEQAPWALFVDTGAIEDVIIIIINCRVMSEKCKRNRSPLGVSLDNSIRYIKCFQTCLPVGGVFSPTEMSEVLTEILKADPNFSKQEFLNFCEYEIIPNVLEVRKSIQILKTFFLYKWYIQKSKMSIVISKLMGFF